VPDRHAARAAVFGPLLALPPLCLVAALWFTPNRWPYPADVLRAAPLLVLWTTYTAFWAGQTWASRPLPETPRDRWLLAIGLGTAAGGAATTLGLLAFLLW
jgi:hypothetical protein